jgi:hypothetical protein
LQLHSFLSEVSKSSEAKNCEVKKSEVKKMKLSDQLRILVNRLKHRFFNTQTQQFVLFFDDFFPSEKIFGFLSISFLKPLHNMVDQELQRKRRIHLRAFTAVSIFLMILMMINFVMVAREPDKFVETIETFAFIWTYGFVLAKTFLLCFWKGGALKSIIGKLELFFPHSSREQLQFGAFKFHRWLKNVHRACLVVYIWTVVHFAYTALFVHSFGFGTALAFPIYFPLDPYQPMLYPIFFILQTWTMIALVLVLVATDVFFCGLIGTTSLEFEVVAQKITRIDPENDEHADRKMSEIIDTYNELIDVTNELEAIFSPLLLVNVFAGIFVVCATVFLLFVSTR